MFVYHEMMKLNKKKKIKSIKGLMYVEDGHFKIRSEDGNFIVWEKDEKIARLSFLNQCWEQFTDENINKHLRAGTKEPWREMREEWELYKQKITFEWMKKGKRK